MQLERGNGSGGIRVVRGWALGGWVGGTGEERGGCVGWEEESAEVGVV